MSYYSVDVSCTVEIELTTKYECENCGRVSSYRQTYDTSVNERGQTTRKSKAAAQKLTRELSIKAQKRAKEMGEDWKTEGPESFEYHITYEKCPHCGYSQSWMQKYLRGRQRSKYIKWPFFIVSFAYILWYVNGLESILNGLVGDLAGFNGIVTWAVVAGITYLIGKGILKYTDPNRKFGAVETINEPTFIWGEPIITK